MMYEDGTKCETGDWVRYCANCGLVIAQVEYVRRAVVGWEIMTDKGLVYPGSILEVRRRQES